jgi:hypothetical protein
MRTIVSGVLERIPKPTPAMAVALLALIIAASGAAVAAIPSPDGTITACRDNKSGALRVINADPPQPQGSCTSKETKLTWINGLPGSTVADSDKLDGKSAEDLSRVAVMSSGATPEIPTDPARVTYGQQLSITAPAAGFVLVNGNVTVLNGDCESKCVFVAYVHHVNTNTDSQPSVETLEGVTSASSQIIEGNVGLDAVFPVSAGVNTFEIQLTDEGASGRLFGDFGVLTAEYIPYGSTGTGTL